MSERKQSDGLESYFEAARADPPLPGGDWLARMEARAIAEAPRAPARMPERPGLLERIRESLGGWPGIAGLISASVFGLWLGVTGTLTADDLWSGQTQLLVLDPVTAYDLAWAEE